MAPPSRSAAREPHVPFAAQIRSASRAAGVPYLLMVALVAQESAFDPAAESSAGAQGLTQLMPATARELGVTNAFDPDQALRGGARYLSAQRARFGSWRLALAAYNAGPGAVSGHDGIPPYPETREYVRRVTERWSALRAG